MLNISLPIIVEGKYDKIKILSIANAYVIVLNGFSIFNDKEMQQFIKKIAKNGIIILTDSDGAGLNIRGKLNSFLSPDRVYNLYIPSVLGKEKRKDSPSKEGLLGVEGMSSDILIKLLSPFDSSVPKENKMLTKTDFYFLGLSGKKDSKEKRKYLCSCLSLPSNISSNALLDAINLLISEEDFNEAMEKVNEKWKNYTI